jgi:hypothetical protein
MPNSWAYSKLVSEAASNLSFFENSHIVIHNQHIKWSQFTNSIMSKSQFLIWYFTCNNKRARKIQYWFYVFIIKIKASNSKDALNYKKRSEPTSNHTQVYLHAFTASKNDSNIWYHILTWIQNEYFLTKCTMFTHKPLQICHTTLLYSQLGTLPPYIQAQSNTGYAYMLA